MKNIVMGNNIEKSFGEGNEKTNVLNGVTVNIGEGEFVALMGPSGSGKTTLMFALSGMDSIDNGKIVFHDQDLSALSENELADLRRNNIGFVFQQPTMLKNLNILDNIILPSLKDNKNKTPDLVQKAKELMKKMGIENLVNRDITQVSGGQLQRAGICRALIGEPEIIFGDEPTGSLNSKSAQEIMDIIGNINQDGTAVLLVTHDAKVAAQVQRILFMQDGNIVDELNLPKYEGKLLDSRMKLVLEKMRQIEI